MISEEQTLGQKLAKIREFVNRIFGGFVTGMNVDVHLSPDAYESIRGANLNAVSHAPGGIEYVTLTVGDFSVNVLEDEDSVAGGMDDEDIGDEDEKDDEEDGEEPDDGADLIE